jgi:plastocyanin
VIIIAITTCAFAGTIQGNAAPKSVVYVDAVPGKSFPAPSQKPTLGQQSLAFSPHILVIQQGTTVEFLNNDSVQHNVFWPSVSGNKKEAHNLGTWPKGEKHSFTFVRPGVVPLFCNVHPEMSGYIVVSPTPYFAESDAAGKFRIDNVPDGKYTLIAWHEGAKPQAQPLELAGDVTINFTSSK